MENINSHQHAIAIVNDVLQDDTDGKGSLIKIDTARAEAALCGPGCFTTHSFNRYFVCGSCKHNPFYYICGNRRCRRFKNE